MGNSCSGGFPSKVTARDDSDNSCRNSCSGGFPSKGTARDDSGNSCRNSCNGFPSKGTGRDDSGNTFLTADSITGSFSIWRTPFLLGKTDDPAFKWAIYGFSALFEREAIPASSASFDCRGYKWFLQVSPMHRESGTKIPYVAVFLALNRSSLKPGYVMHALFELSIYNHSNGSYCGCKVRYDFSVNKLHSEKECLITVEELLKSADFLVDDSCVFSVRILQADVSPKNNLVVDPDNTITTRELFLQKKEFIKGNYTWNVNNFLALKDSVISPSFEACVIEFNVGCFYAVKIHPRLSACSLVRISQNQPAVSFSHIKSASLPAPATSINQRIGCFNGINTHIKMHPLGDKDSTDSLSMYLYMHDPAEFSSESGKMFEVTLSILDQEQGQHYSRAGRVVVNGNRGWGWSDFIPLEILKDPSEGYLVGSNWSVEADITCIGSCSDVQTPLTSLLKDEK